MQVFVRLQQYVFEFIFLHSNPSCSSYECFYECILSLMNLGSSYQQQMLQLHGQYQSSNMIKIRSVQKYRLFFLSCFLLFFDFNIFVYSRKFSIQYTFQIVTLDSHKLLVGAGTAADCVNFNEFIGKNMKLYELNNDIQLSTKAAANYIRGEVERL